MGQFDGSQTLFDALLEAIMVKVYPGRRCQGLHFQAQILLASGDSQGPVKGLSSATIVPFLRA